MRFEAKHRFGKALASTILNFKNICKTIAHRTQMELAHSLLNNMLYRSERVVVSCSSVLLNMLDHELSCCISTGIGLSSCDEVHIANSVLIGHYQFKPGCCTVLRCEGRPIFGELLIIVAIDSGIYFVRNEMKTLDYFAHFHSYRVELSGKLVIQNSNTLKDPHPLCVHKVFSGGRELCLIAPRYNIL